MKKKMIALGALVVVLVVVILLVTGRGRQRYAENRHHHVHERPGFPFWQPMPGCDVNGS